MQSHIIPVLGCSLNQIDPFAGVFGVFGLTKREKFKQSEHVTPVKNQGTCPHRFTPLCDINCPNAVSGFVSGHVVSYSQEGKRI